MKKKIFLLSATMILALSSIASASSLWGNYKGNEIIKIKLEGKELISPTVPAYMTPGSVMVPLNLLRSIGVLYSYDDKNKTVNFQRVKSTGELTAINNAAKYAALNSVNKIKTYFGLLENYQRYIEFAKNTEPIFQPDQSLVFVFITYKDTSARTDELKKTIKNKSEALERINTSYNSLVSMSNNLTTKGDLDIIIPSFSSILDSYKSALDQISSIVNDAMSMANNGSITAKDAQDIDQKLVNARQGISNGNDKANNAVNSLRNFIYSYQPIS